MDLIGNLNDMQKLAVTTTEGPVLVLAGAGSGKTTVLVARLAYILSKLNVSPYRVLAITFTNKAAAEMKERIKSKIGAVADQMWIGTFHSMCVRLLRTNIDLIGFNKDFLIYDTNDSKLVIRECMKQLNIDEKNFSLKSVMSVISRAKDDVMTPEIFESVHKNDLRLNKIAKIYAMYQKRLKKNNALDFDDIIVKSIQVLSENPEELEKYREKFKYIMVDEYQDTNNAQYMLISLLAGKYKNLCVVGDDDQSIYKFRGANIRNILDFEIEFPEAVTIKLEQNYRSTQNILNAANAVIANNKERKGKKLWTSKDGGDKITLFTAANEHEEGMYIAKRVEEYVKGGGSYSDCAVLYRINAQSRVLEEMFMRMNVPYRVLAGLRFYDRKEIKDAIAYLRVIYNNGDDVSLRRIVNEPKRGIGQTTVEKGQKIADEKGIALFEVFKNADSYSELSRAAAKLIQFTKMMSGLSELVGALSLSDLVVRVLADSGYSLMVHTLAEAEGTSREENLKELISVVKEYEEALTEDASLSDFLEKVALVSDVDNYDAEQDSVVLMTIHSAKGLEFPVVFLPGMENGLFPGSTSLSERDEIEEERRLCYVAITRAKRMLFITKAKTRMIFGKTVNQSESLFLGEIPQDCIECKSTAAAMAEKALRKIGFERVQQRNTRDWRSTNIRLPNRVFSNGDKVKHPKFGVGTVLSAIPFGDDYKVEVMFDSCGKKMLMSNFAKLEKV